MKTNKNENIISNNYEGMEKLENNNTNKNQIHNNNLSKDNNKKSISDEFFMENDDWESTSEPIYKQRILDEKWVKNSEYLNINELQKNIPSFHYLDKHLTYLESSLPEKMFQILIKEPKKLERKGMPPNYMHDFLLNIFGIKDIDKSHYNTNYTLIFKNHDPNNLGDFVPYFSGKETLKESLPYHYLNEKGINELKIILWMIGDNYRNIAFSPIIIKLLSLILIFCNKYEAFEIMCKLIEQENQIEQNNEYLIRWRLKFSYEDNKKLINSISQCLKEISPRNRNKYYDNLNHIFFNLEDLYEDMCFNFFINYLNFYGIIRFLPFYLIEGVKSFYRLIYALETEFYNIEFDDRNEVIPKIREKCKKIDNIQELFNNSYKFKLTRYNNKYVSQKTIEINPLKNTRNDFYLPTFKGGDLLTDYEIIQLWRVLPFEYKIKNASLIYQASKDGYNLPNILTMEEKYNKNTNILFLIETEKEDKFGFISSNLIMHTDNKYQRPSASLLFTIGKEPKIYSPIDSDEILYVTSKDFIFGNGPSGPAIQLNQDLKEGDSYSGGCFNNPCLVKDKEGHFSVKKLEIFKLE